jgi:2-oxoglutarate dehydrogenase E2 component (dihydrolipoamide succinyltransferase)
MPAEIRVPQMGESVTEATILRWLKKVGETVAAGEAVAELETDKVNVEVPADTGGIIQSFAHAEGDTVAVGDVLAVVGDAAGAVAAPAPTTVDGGGAGTEPSIPATSASSPTPPPSTVVGAGGTTPRSGDGAPIPAASPLARTLAEDNKIDLGLVKGTGPVGRITKDDVANFIERSADAPATANALAAQTAQPTPVASADPSLLGKGEASSLTPPSFLTPPSLTGKGTGGLGSSQAGGPARPEERSRMSRRRQTIATRLVEAQHTAAMLTTFNEVDMSAVMAIRAKRKDSFKEKNGIGLGFMSFFTKASIGALKAFPLLNAEIQGLEIVKKGYYDIGIAVGAEEGLVVPVVRDADKLTFAGIEKEIAGLAQRAKNNTLTIEEMRGGTFTITNGGVFGSLLSTPILNAPQVGILGLHKIEPRPIALSGEVVIRPMMYLALSYDHRIVDGSEAVRFLVRIKELIEDPEALLLEG